VLEKKQTNQFFGVFDIQKGISRKENVCHGNKKARISRAGGGRPMNLLEGYFREAA
jgi:hypothetical protein